MAGLRFTALAALLAAGLIVTSGALADDDYEEATHLKESGAILPLAEIITRAQAIRPGRVIETELKQRNGRYLYSLEILDDKGVVTELALDATTGEPLADEDDDRRPEP